MSRRPKSAGAQKRRRRTTFLWLAAVAAVIITLLVLEQVAVLYVLATLSVVVLLVIVAWSDLGETKALTQPAPFDDSAAIGDGRTTQTATSGGASTARARRR